ncbi:MULTISPECIES: alpha/beta hydrolase [Fusobacterium]|uniref:alpha/beta hydrolase n=1 Tax=Fusobacterium TaxID=848 RepID=UPI00041C739B|nr:MULTISPECIES: alpha/beta hydrolase [Fusobacterium]
MKKISILILIVISFFYTKNLQADDGKVGEKMLKKEYLNANSTIEELLTYPSIKEFSKFILPLELGYNPNSKLKDIDYLLPYHNNINVKTTLNSINYIIDKSEKGEKIFYKIYTDEEIKLDKSKENTGIFFFKGNKNAPFAVINAGGGFSYVGSIHEGFPYAMELNKRGYNAFVLQYRVGDGYKATQDLARAVSYIIDNKDIFEVDANNYSLWGSSAGARMVAAIGSRGLASFGGKDYNKPNMLVMLYTGLANFTVNDPPTFMAVGEKDLIANPKVVKNRFNEMKKANLKVEFHKYKNVGHGFGLGIDTSADNWIDSAIKFWENTRR